MDKKSSSEFRVKSLKLGKFRLSLLSGGRFWLDGGAMFGIIPKPLWEKLNPSDSRNRIELGLNCLLVDTGDKKILIDTGISGIDDAKFNDIYKVHYVDLSDSLSEMRLTPEDIDIVINTHLHFDHCGGNTRRVGSKYVPSFSNAKYIIQEAEWYDGIHPNERTQGSYILDTFIPLEESGNLKLVNGEVEILPGIKVCLTGGHTRGHQVVLLESMGEKGIYFGDLIPTTSHIKLPYVMSYDSYPLDTVKKKKELLKLALAERWLLIFEHDPKVMMGYLKKKDGEPIFIGLKD
jgi:glyoxylase-like metal-dependent hydrolase (beta-lactamase superfamily II)